MSHPLRVLVVGSSAGGGDWPPLVAAALALAEAGHDITYYGDEQLAAATHGTGLRMECAPPELDLDLRVRARRFQRNRDPAAPSPTAVWAVDAEPLVVRLARAVTPDLILCTYFTAPLAHRVRERIGVPVCFINATYYVGPQSRRRLQDDVAGPSMRAAISYEQLMLASDLVLHATDGEFDPPPVPPPPNHHWIGTLVWEPQRPVPAWLTEPGNPWALVTLGSLRQDDELDLARAAITVLADLPVRVLVTLGDAEPQDALQTDAANVRIETFVPHSPVLERAALCVAHAGHGIVAKAMHFGVPMVLVPWGRDQPGVAARAAALGVARVVGREQLTTERLADAIRAVLDTSSYAERARYHQARIRSGDPRDRVRQLIGAFMSPGETSARELPAGERHRSRPALPSSDPTPEA